MKRHCGVRLQDGRGLPRAPGGLGRGASLFALIALALAPVFTAGCGGSGDSAPVRASGGAGSPGVGPGVGTGTSPAAPGPYAVSPQGGTPASGPGARYNHCERIWCLVHGENYFIDHYLKGHEG